MKKKILAIALVVAMLAIAVIGGTLAYFTDKDYAENTMTIGNIDIIQNEYEYDENGDLVPFTQDKPLFPYVGTISWDAASKTAEVNGAAAGAYRQFGMNNVIDKYVTVENTGKNDAYVRTFIALEMGDTHTVESFQQIGISNNSSTGSEFKFPGTWVWEYDYVIEIDGHKYWVASAVHEDALAPTEESVPSLLQIYLAKDATQEDAAKSDSDNNCKYTIHALTQGVQANGFDSAEAALDEAFGDVTAANLQAWFAEAIA